MFLFTLASAFAGEHSIVNGDATDAFPQVVALYAADESGNGFNFCSGTVIGPKTVVTAAHCLAGMDEVVEAGYPRLLIVSGNNVNTQSGVSEEIDASFWVAHPEYNNSTLEHDIGVIGLEAEFSFDVMPVNKDVLKDTDIGKDYRYVGWGVTSDAGMDSGVKRYADIPLYDFDDMFQFGYDEEDVQNVCYGDSGGAALEVQAEGGFELSGVNSFVSDDDDTYCHGGYNGATRIDAHLSWLEQYTELWNAEELAIHIEQEEAEQEEEEQQQEEEEEEEEELEHDGTALPDELPAFHPEESLPEPAAGCATAPSASGAFGLSAGMLLLRRRRR